MRRALLYAAAGLLPCLLVAAAAADGPKGKKPTKPSDKVVETDCGCGDYGTSVQFHKTPSEAARKAEKTEKLVFVLHVSGDFENSDFTWNNAEALRVNALADPKVGKYINEYFESSFQRVATFRIVGKQKQGGNVASYFCAPDGRVLHVIPGPVNSAVMLREAQWVVEMTKKAMAEAKDDGAAFKAFFRKAHAEKLRTDYGVTVQPVTFDPPIDANDGPLTYKDPSGKPLAPKLPPSPIDGPDVKFDFRQAELKSALKAGGAGPAACGLCLVNDRGGRGLVLDNLGRGRQLLTAHGMAKIETIYASIFEGILNEKVTTKPVEVVHPFPWHGRGGPNGPGIILPKGIQQPQPGILPPNGAPPNGPGLFPGRVGG